MVNRKMSRRSMQFLKNKINNMKNLKEFKLFVESMDQDKNLDKLQYVIDLVKGKISNENVKITTLYKQPVEEGNYQLYFIDAYDKNSLESWMVSDGKNEYYLCDDFVANDKGEIVSYDIGKIIHYADNFEGRTNIRSSEVETFFNMIDEKF